MLNVAIRLEQRPQVLLRDVPGHLAQQRVSHATAGKRTRRSCMHWAGKKPLRWRQPIGASQAARGALQRMCSCGLLQVPNALDFNARQV